MNTHYQILLSAVAIAVAMFAGIWLFNHVNPWLGVATVLLTIYAAVRVVIYFINKPNKNKKQ